MAYYDGNYSQCNFSQRHFVPETMVNQTMLTTEQNTLHLLTNAPSHWFILIPQICAVWQAGDLLLLLAEGAQGFDSAAINPFNQIAVLDLDLARLEVSSSEIPPHIKIASIADWATWTVQYQRTVTWR
jgi:hypothetical protein